MIAQIYELETENGNLKNQNRDKKEQLERGQSTYSACRVSLVAMQGSLTELKEAHKSSAALLQE